MVKSLSIIAHLAQMGHNLQWQVWLVCLKGTWIDYHLRFTRTQNQKWDQNKKKKKQIIRKWKLKEVPSCLSMQLRFLIQYNTRTAYIFHAVWLYACKVNLLWTDDIKKTKQRTIVHILHVIYHISILSWCHWLSTAWTKVISNWLVSSYAHSYLFQYKVFIFLVNTHMYSIVPSP